MFGWHRKPIKGFPQGFRRQRVGIRDGGYLADLSPADIVSYFRAHPESAQTLLNESYDKRYSPSSFLTEESDGYSVGWYSTRRGYECEIRFTDLADAATDYFLFSLGRGRWNPAGVELRAIR
jgi:hypothetical protein